MTKDQICCITPEVHWQCPWSLCRVWQIKLSYWQNAHHNSAEEEKIKYYMCLSLPAYGWKIKWERKVMSWSFSRTVLAFWELLCSTHFTTPPRNSKLTQSEGMLWILPVCIHLSGYNLRCSSSTAGLYRSIPILHQLPQKLWAVPVRTTQKWSENGFCECVWNNMSHTDQDTVVCHLSSVGKDVCG